MFECRHVGVALIAFPESVNLQKSQYLFSAPPYLFARLYRP